MKLNSARLAWHDALYTAWDSQGAHVEQLGMLGTSIQKTEASTNCNHAMHQAISARIQHAIATLPDNYRNFGNHMYSPLGTDYERDDLRETVEGYVFRLAVSNSPKMMGKKYIKAEYVAAAVLMRYRRLHQGGQSEGVDPAPTPESFRKYLLDMYGVDLDSRNWGREWEGFIEICFDACNHYDKFALIPVARVMAEMKKAA